MSEKTPRTKEKVGIQEATRRLGLTHQAAGTWASRPGAPIEMVAGKRLLVWPDFPRWRDEQLREGAKRELRPSSLEGHRQRREGADADLRELELAERRGQLMRVELHVKTLADAYGRVRAKLVNLPQLVAMRITGKTVSERAEQARGLVAEVLEELADGSDIPKNGGKRAS